MSSFNKSILLLILIFTSLFTSTQTVHADIVSTTQEQLKANVERVKTSLTTLGNDIKNLQSEISSAANSSAQEALDKYKGLVEDLKSKVGSGDIKGIKEEVEKLKKDITSGDILKDLGDDLKAPFLKIQNDFDKAVYSVKNIASVNYTCPVGMRGGYGQTGLEIAIDTLKYTRTDNGGGVYMDVRADFQLPFSIAEGETNTKIGFLGEDIALKGEGGAKIMLDTKNTTGKFSDAQDIAYFPIMSGKAKIGVHKNSYIEIDCNGFKALYLKGEFVFSSNIITPAEYAKTGNKEDKDKGGDTANGGENANAGGDAANASAANTGDAAKGEETKTAGKDSVVTAEFSLYITDLEDIIIEAGFKTPFKIKCTGDIIYEVKGVVADFSTLKNADGFQFPKGYVSPFKGTDDAYWTGFAIKTLKVSVGDEIPFIDTLSAYNMLIDETGVSGWFGASFGEGKGELKTGVIDTKIDKIEVAIANGKVKGGGLKGNLDVVALKDKKGETLNLALNGELYSDASGNFCYSIGVENLNSHTYTLPLLETSEITLGAGTSITYKKELDIKRNGTEVDSSYRKGFFFNMNGSLDLKASFVQVEGLSFQDLKLSTCAPYFGGGKFALNSAKSLNLGALEMELLNVSAGFDTTGANWSASLGAEVNVKLIGDGKGVSCGGKFSCFTKVKKDEEPSKKWEFDRLQVDKISVEADFSAFYLRGVVQKYESNPKELTPKDTFGRGFRGELEIRMDALNIDVQAAAQFGKTRFNPKNDNEKEYRYWYVYANVGLPPGTIIFPPAVMLNSVSLALYSKMNYTIDQTTKEITRNYFPDKTMAFGFQGGIKVYAAQESLVGAEMKLGMNFSSGGGVKDINLEGGVYMLSTSQQNSFITGTVISLYDFEEKIFKFDAEVGANIKDIISGSAHIKLYSDPKKWYFRVGDITSPTYTLKFAGLAKAKAYFMLGHDIPASLPPLDSRITELFGVTQSTASGHQEECKSGKGFAFGAAVNVGCGLDKFIYAYVNFIGGVDVLIVKRPGENCSGSAYRGYGRAYVWLDLAAGVKPRKKKFEFLEVSAAAEVDAEFPKPLYLHGKIGFRYKVLGGLFKGNANAKFEAGSTCNWTPNGQKTASDGEYDFAVYKKPSMDIDTEDGENLEELLRQHGETDDTDIEYSDDELNKFFNGSENNNEQNGGNGQENGSDTGDGGSTESKVEHQVIGD